MTRSSHNHFRAIVDIVDERCSQSNVSHRPIVIANRHFCKIVKIGHNYNFPVSKLCNLNCGWSSELYSAAVQSLCYNDTVKRLKCYVHYSKLN